MLYCRLSADGPDGSSRGLFSVDLSVNADACAAHCGHALSIPLHARRCKRILSPHCCGAKCNVYLVRGGQGQRLPCRGPVRALCNIFRVCAEPEVWLPCAHFLIVCARALHVLASFCSHARLGSGLPRSTAAGRAAGIRRVCAVLLDTVSLHFHSLMVAHSAHSKSVCVGVAGVWGGSYFFAIFIWMLLRRRKHAVATDDAGIKRVGRAARDRGSVGAIVCSAFRLGHGARPRCRRSIVACAVA